VIDVDDIIQETFIRAIAEIHSLRIRTRKGFARWLQTIAVNQLTDIMLAEKRIKRGKGRRVVLKGSRKKHRSSIRDLSQWFVDRQDTPARAFRRDERIRAVQVEIASLPNSQREALRLHELEGLSVIETSAKMGRTPAANRGLLDRARRTLRAALGRSSRWFSSR
jgi:RNA polymerase sigma factor (sigma-70 family)